MNPGFVKGRMRLALGSGPGSKSSTFIVHWQSIAGGTADPTTNAVVGGDETQLSGTLRGFRHEEGVQTKLRMHSEIQVGDLLVDIDPDALVTIIPGQIASGTVALDALAESGVRLESAGQMYAPAEVGEELAAAWAVIFQDQQLIRTILLRRAT